MGSASREQRNPDVILEPRLQLLHEAGLVLLGVSYRTSKLPSREDFMKVIAPDGSDLIGSVPGVDEHVVLATCNRIEVYLVTSTPDLTLSALAERIESKRKSGLGPLGIFSLRGRKVVDHLFEVAAGLDSIVLGEPQILAQVRSAGVAARRVGSAKGVLSPIFDRAFRVGSRIRESFDLGNGEASMGSLAVDAILQSARVESNVLLIGTGKMVQLAARRLSGKKGRVYVASKRKTVPKGLGDFDLISYRAIPKFSRKCGIIIAATNSEYPLLRKEHFKGGGRKTIVDLGMPRNVSPSVRKLRNVRLLDLDDLAVRARTLAPPRGFSPALAATRKEASEFYAWLIQTRLSSTLSQLYYWANGVRDAELRRAAGRLKLNSPRDRRVLESMGRRIVSKLMARPTKFARARYNGFPEEDKLELLNSVFGLGEGIGED